MIDVFEISQLKTTAPIFDTEKLRWMNGEYIRMKSNAELKKLLQRDDPIIDKILPLVKERMKTLTEFESLAGFFYEKPTVAKQPHEQLLQTILSSCPWNHDAMESAIREAAEKENLKARDLFMELRLAITGNTVGPPLLESMEILGKDETLSRLTVQT